MKTFQQYLELAKSKQPFVVDDTWAQGRSVFGGLSAALLLQHIEANTDFTDRELRSINVHFCAALIANEIVHLEYEVLSSGKSVTHIQAKLTQDDGIKTLISCCFANERPSEISVDAQIINTPSIENTQKFPFIPGLTPNFIQHIDMRLNSSNFPFSGSEPETIKGWMSFENHDNAYTDSAILALIDAWPPATLPLIKKPAPSSSVTWNIEFIHPRSPISENAPLYYECDLVQAASGLAHTEAKVFSENGELLALSRQVVAIYDKK